MKTCPVIALVAIAGTLGLAGCKPHPTTLAGQVFIVTQGGDNVKLGDIEILLVEKSQVRSFLQKKEPIIESEIASKKQELAVAREDDNKRFAAHKAEEAKYEHSQYSLEAWNEKTRVFQLWSAAYARLGAAEKTLQYVESAENYLMGFSPVITQKTTSDADGRFSFVYPRDKALTIYASAQRSLLNGTEKYYWLVDAPTNAEMVQVFLSNNNLVFVDPDGYFKLKPKQPR
jgi:hypothetical protein